MFPFFPPKEITAPLIGPSGSGTIKAINRMGDLNPEVTTTDQWLQWSHIIPSRLSTALPSLPILRKCYAMVCAFKLRITCFWDDEVVRLATCLFGMK